MHQYAKGVKGCRTDTKDKLQGQPADPKNDPKGCKPGRSWSKTRPKEEQGPWWAPKGVKGRRKRPQRESIEEPDGIPETKWKLAWTQKVSKKEPKLETLEMMKIELPLQRELNPAC